MKIVENNVKCGEIRIFGHKFYKKTANFLSNFVSGVEILLKNFVAGLGFLNENLVARRSGKLVTGQGDTFMLITYYKCMYS